MEIGFLSSHSLVACQASKKCGRISQYYSSALTVVVFGEAGLESLQFVAGGHLLAVDVGVALETHSWKEEKKR